MHVGRKNGFIDVQKFIYAWLIVAFHFGNATTDYLPGGASAVEFFVLTSGIFFFTGWEKKKQNIDVHRSGRMENPLHQIHRMR